MFRLYVKSDCPFCCLAKDFLKDRGAKVEVISTDNDPLLARGIEFVLGQFQVPLLISFVSRELVIGFKPNEYDRVLRIAGGSTIPSHDSTN